MWGPLLSGRADPGEWGMSPHTPKPAQSQAGAASPRGKQGVHGRGLQCPTPGPRLVSALPPCPPLPLTAASPSHSPPVLAHTLAPAHGALALALSLALTLSLLLPPLSVPASRPPSLPPLSSTAAFADCSSSRRRPSLLGLPQPPQPPAPWPAPFPVGAGDADILGRQGLS